MVGSKVLCGLHLKLCYFMPMGFYPMLSITTFFSTKQKFDEHGRPLVQIIDFWSVFNRSLNFWHKFSAGYDCAFNPLTYLNCPRESSSPHLLPVSGCFVNRQMLCEALKMLTFLASEASQFMRNSKFLSQTTTV